MKETIIEQIKAAIKGNDNQEITGLILQDILKVIVEGIFDSIPEITQQMGNSQELVMSQYAVTNGVSGIVERILGTTVGYTYVGTATTATVPINITAVDKVFYIAIEEGAYAFNLPNPVPGLSILKSVNGHWQMDYLGLPASMLRVQTLGDNDKAVMSQKAVTGLYNQGYRYVGAATSYTIPAVLKGDEKIFYIATQRGSYHSDFGLAGPIENLTIFRSDAGRWRADDLGMPLEVSDILDEFEAHIQNEFSRQDGKITEQTDEIGAFKDSIIRQIDEYRPIVIEGDATNAADEEDLTAENGLIKIANRGTLYGKGYKILRRGADLQTQFNQDNTVYEIRYDFDLGGNTIKIPSGCALMFTGGSFDNGCLLGDNTAIVAGAYKIFGDGLILHQCCFSYKSGSIESSTEQNIELPWIDIPKRIVKYQQSTKKRNWILTNDSGIRCSNFEGNCQFKKIDSLDIEFNIDSEFLLNANPDKFSKIDSSTPHVAEHTLNTLDVIYLSSHKNGSVLTIPRTSKWAFFTSNNEDDNLNETYILPGTEVDLSERSIYCTSLNRAFIHPEASTWLDACKLEWFVGDSFYKSFDDFKVGGILPQEKNLQRALDSSMDIESSIRGIIPCENTLYAEVRKKINLGSRYNITDNDAFVGNAQYKVKFSIPSTIILGLSDSDLFVQRTTLTFYGGLLTTCYADVHNKNLWVVDMDYRTSYSDINTSLLGKIPNKGYFTNAAFIAKADKNGNGYTSFSKYNLYTKHTKYGIYAEQYGASYINSCEINAYIFGYYEGAHIESSFGASIINITLQASPGIPIAEVDNYRNAYISTSRSMINIINWDFSAEKTNAEIQNPYKKILIEGNNIVVGNLALSAGAPIEPYTDNTVSRNKKLIVTRTINTPLSLPLMENVFAGISSAQIDECYYRKISCSSAIDIANLNEKIDISDSNYTYENITTSIYVLANMFSVSSGLLSTTALNSNQFVEAYLKLKEGFTLDRGVRFKQCALDFGNYPNIFKYAKIIFFKNDTTYYKDIELVEGCSFAIFDLNESFITDVAACLIRLYGDRSDNWGVGKEIASTFFMPQIRGYSIHESCNYFYRKFQPITYAATGSRPSSNVVQGEMYFDSNLKKPIWWTGTAWVDATGTTV